MIKVAVTSRIVSENSYEETRDALSHDMSNYLHNQGFLPVIIPNNIDIAMDLVQETEALIISGGNDLIFKSENQDESILTEKIISRNELEMKILDYFLAEKLPVIGICHGMQLINHFFGGSIKSLNDKSHVNNLHRLEVDSSKFLGDFLPHHCIVNSFHDNVISDVGNGLEVLARAEDNSIESIGNLDQKILGIMWHPERSNKEFDVFLLRKFVTRFQ